MRLKRRAATVIKWAAFACCAALFLVGITSFCWIAGCHWGDWLATTNTGVLVLVDKPGWAWPPGGYASHNDNLDVQFWLPFVGGAAEGEWVAIIPLWIPLALLGTPTLLFWWLDRRRIPAGHCRKCGYNLTGNVSGRCPECGADARPVGRVAGKPRG
jgi:hypothetical protein